MTSRQVYCLLLAAEQSQGCSTDLREGLLTDQPRNRTRAQYCAIETSLCPLSRSRQAKRGSPGTYSTRRPDGRRCQRWKIMKTRPLLHTTGEEEEDKLGSCQEGRGLRLLDADGRMYMDLNCKGASIFWRPTFCSNCGKPKITHPRISRVCFQGLDFSGPEGDVRTGVYEQPGDGNGRWQPCCQDQGGEEPSTKFRWRRCTSRHPQVRHQDQALGLEQRRILF